MKSAHVLACAALVISIGMFLKTGHDVYAQIQQEKAADATPTEQQVRQAVVVLLGDSESNFCSGVQVLSPTQRTYILTAAHCATLGKGGVFAFKDEAGVVRPAFMLKFDLETDIMLLSAGTGQGLPIAPALAVRESVRIVGHGSGDVIPGPFPTYSRYGEALGEHRHTFYLLKDCTATGCPEISHVLTTVSAPVLPGSSGGALLNTKNEVVGIVSIYCPGGFSGHVPLSVIHAILKDR